MLFKPWSKSYLTFSLIVVVLAFLFSLEGGSTTLAQVNLTLEEDLAGSTRNAAAITDPVNPQGIVFALSGDLTDDPTQMNLYIADGEQIVEMFFTQVVAPAVPSFTSTLVQTIDTSMWSSPSPDPTGIIYLESSGTLLISDSEINEMSVPTNTVQFTGDNLFESSLTGVLSDTLTTWVTQTMEFSDEPSGVTLNPDNGHLFFSDDTGPKVVYEIDLGANGLYDWPGDSITWFRTGDFGSLDPEGVTFASGPGTLFIADDTNNEIYQVAPGPNGLFDGVAPAGDDVVASFDTAGLGVNDPEGIAYNPDNGHLYVVGGISDNLYELTTRGALVQTIDISAANANNPAGLAYAPSSQVPNVKNIYIVARGADNDVIPAENDGMLYEMTLPTNTNVLPVAVNDTAVTAEGTPVTIDVHSNDIDDNLDPNSALTDITICPICSEPANGSLHNNGDGTFVYTPTLNFIGGDSFVYEICDTDGACDTATVDIEVTEKQKVFIPVQIKN